MTQSYIIEPIEPPFEVTKKSIAGKLPEWVDRSCFWSPNPDGFAYDKAGSGLWGDFLLKHPDGSISVRSPEWVAQYVKGDPWEECARIADQYREDAGGSVSYRMACCQIAQAIRSLGDKA